MTSAPVSPGEMLAGKYRVLHVLGAGGIGVVVAALDVRLDRKVALKFLLPEHALVAEARERFSREARAVARLKSEHVARVLDVGTLDDQPGAPPYIVMEYLEGKDLGQLAGERGRLPVDATVGYLLQACQALAEAHALGIVHRDLKPANLFLTTDASGNPTIKVLDFGIAKTSGAGAADAALTTTRGIMGSPLYMSPEQLSSARDVDGRTDIWALGAILYELVAGRPPLIADTLPQLCTAILHTPIEPPSRHADGIPPALDALVMRCLERAPEQRFANVAELAAALQPLAPGGAGVTLRSAASGSLSLSDSFDRTLAASDPNAASNPLASSNPIPESAQARDTTAQSWGSSRLARGGSRRKAGPWIAGLSIAALTAGGLLVYKLVPTPSEPHTESPPLEAREPKTQPDPTVVEPLAVAPPASGEPAVDAGKAAPNVRRKPVAPSTKPLPSAAKPAPTTKPATPGTDFMKDRE